MPASAGNHSSPQPLNAGMLATGSSFDPSRVASQSVEPRAKYTYCPSGDSWGEKVRVALGDRHGMSAVRTHLPHRTCTGVLPVYKIDPCPVMGPAWQVIAVYVDVQLVGNAAAGIDNPNVGLATRARVEGEQAFPSGDQRADPVSNIPKCVSCCPLEPSTLHTHTSLAPLLVDSNAIMLPSGEMLGPV